MGQQCCHPPPPRHGTHTHSPPETKKRGWKRNKAGCNNGADHKTYSCIIPRPATPENWTLSRAELMFTKAIARDFLGSSWQGKWKDIEVEIRTVKLNKKGAEACLEEAELLKGLCHPNLLNVLGVCTEETELHIVTEHLLSGTSLLLSGWKERGEMGLPLHLHVLSQVASGLAFLEQYNLIHLEVAARNTQITRDLRCKLLVSGMVKECNDTIDASIADTISVVRLAPEVARSGCITIKSCVWAFVYFMLEVLQGRGISYEAFITNQSMTHKSKDKQHSYPFPLPIDDCPPDLHDLLKKCWTDLPENRPTFASLRDSLKDQADHLQEELMVYLESISRF